MRRSTLLILVGLALLGLAAAIVASVLHDGLSAKATPTRLEALVARNARQLAIPKNARVTQNPVLDSPEMQREARLHFAETTEAATQRSVAVSTPNLPICAFRLHKI